MLNRGFYLIRKTTVRTQVMICNSPVNMKLNNGAAYPSQFYLIS